MRGQHPGHVITLHQSESTELLRPLPEFLCLLYFNCPGVTTLRGDQSHLGTIYCSNYPVHTSSSRKTPINHPCADVIQQFCQHPLFIIASGWRECVIGLFLTDEVNVIWSTEQAGGKFLVQKLLHFSKMIFLNSFEDIMECYSYSSTNHISQNL